MHLADIPLILPAAGKSSRLGTPKGLRTHHGRIWLEVQCESFHAAGGKTVVLVLGYDGIEYRKALGISADEYPRAISIDGIEVWVLNNPLPEWGPFTSLQTAAEWITTNTVHPAGFYLPIDTPVPSAGVFAALVDASGSDTDAVEPRLGEVGGHPVLLSRNFLRHILTLDPRDAESRLDFLMRRSRERGRVSSVAVDDRRVAMNLNDAEAWRYFEKYERPSRYETSAHKYDILEGEIELDQPVSSSR